MEVLAATDQNHLADIHPDSIQQAGEFVSRQWREPCLQGGGSEKFDQHL